MYFPQNCVPRAGVANYCNEIHSALHCGKHGGLARSWGATKPAIVCPCFCREYKISGMIVKRAKLGFSIVPWQKENFTTALQKGDETLLSPVFAILGAPGAVSGGERKSKLWEKINEEKSRAVP